VRARDEMSVRRRQSVPLTAPFLAASSGAYAAVWFGSMGGIGNVGFGRIFFLRVNLAGFLIVDLAGFLQE